MNGPFNTCSLLIDHTELYALFAIEPEFYQNLMEFSRERSYSYISALNTAGVDVHCVGGNVPGGFLGRPACDQ